MKFLSHFFKDFIFLAFSWLPKQPCQLVKKIHLPCVANEWPSFEEGHSSLLIPQTTWLILVWNHLGDASSNWCQLSPVCIGEGNSTDPLTPFSTNMQHNLGKLQFIVLENYICSCVVGFYTLPKNILKHISGKQWSPPPLVSFQAFHITSNFSFFCWQCSRIKVTIVSNKSIIQYHC